MENTSFSDLFGRTIVGIEQDDAEIKFHMENGDTYLMHHMQDCCEGVSIEDIAGDLNDLLNSPVLAASEDSNSDNPPEHADSFTWTFYNIATIKGHVTIRWLGQSNGYYSERVDFDKL